MWYHSGCKMPHNMAQVGRVAQHRFALAWSSTIIENLSQTGVSGYQLITSLSGPPKTKITSSKQEEQQQKQTFLQIIEILLLITCFTLLVREEGA